jgi:hypothetical protein
MSAHRLLGATVLIRQRDPEAAPEESGYVEEFVHAAWIERDDFGITLDWGGGRRTFVPWASVVRIEYAWCRCRDCSRAA